MGPVFHISESLNTWSRHRGIVEIAETRAAGRLHSLGQAEVGKANRLGVENCKSSDVVHGLHGKILRSKGRAM